MLSLIVTLAGASPLAAQEPFVESRGMLPRGADSARATTPADVDLDGDADLVITTGSGPNLVYRNLGNGIFEDVPGAFPTSLDGTWSLELGDLDGDGDPDAVRLPNSGKPKLLRNDLGVFTQVGELSVAQISTSVGELGDMDLDGDLDLIVAPYGVEPVRLYENVGAFALTAVPVSFFPSKTTNCADVDLGDLNGDGDLDAYVASRSFTGASTDYVALGRNGLRFDSTPIVIPSDSLTVELADLDGDGDLDAYLSDTYDDSIAWNDGGANFTLAAPVGDPASLYASARDFDGDGTIDLALFSSKDVRLLQGIGAGAYVDVSAASIPTDAYLSDPAVADLDGDGDFDLASFSFIPPFRRLWLNDGGVFGDAHGWVDALPSELFEYRLAIGDVDGDGLADVVGVYNNAIGTPPARLWLGQADGGFALAPGAFPPASDNYAERGALLDVDGDGDLDALVTRFTGSASMYLNDGAGVFAELPGAQPMALQRPVSIKVGDVDGDGDPDVATAHSNWTPSAAVWTNDGTGLLSASFGTGEATGIHYGDIELFDADGDGDLDLALAGMSGSKVMENDGLGNFAEKPGALGSPALLGVESGDVDGDGDLDLLGFGSPDTTLLLNDGGGVFTSSGAFVSPQLGFVIAVFDDYDGDQDLDVVGLARMNDYVTLTSLLMLGDGAGGFDAGTEFGEEALFGPLVDVEGDGDPDMLTTTLDVLVNTSGGQVNRRGVPRVGKPLAIEVFGEPGAPWTLALSAATAEIPVAGFGTLLLDPTKVLVTGTGAVGADGLVSQSFVVPNAPALVGASVWWQALTGAGPTFSNREVTTFTSF